MAPLKDLVEVPIAKQRLAVNSDTISKLEESGCIHIKIPEANSQNTPMS